jgi:hypothetical protein
MNWKFWTSARIRKAEADVAYWKEACLKKDNEINGLLEQRAALAKEVDYWEAQKLKSEEYAQLSERLEAVYQRTPAMVSKADQDLFDKERLMVLAGFADDHSLWTTVLSYLDEHERIEIDHALKANLSDADRHYNAGRAASASDLANLLRDLKLKASRLATAPKSAPAEGKGF